MQAVFAGGTESPGFILAVSAWLWFTVLFANFAEAMAEGRGKAQADSLRASTRDVTAKKLAEPQLRRDCVNQCRLPPCARMMSCWSKRAI